MTLKNIAAGTLVIIGIAPIVYLLLMAPMAWLLFNFNIAPAVTGGTPGDQIGRVFAGILLLPAWAWFFITLGDAIDS